MYFGHLGISYKNTPLEIRGKATFTDTKKLEFLQQAQKAEMDQCMILSTCNRSELFFFYERESQQEAILEIYQSMFDGIILKDFIVQKTGREALSYLFRVTAGLESLVLGEDQILGQVKEALDFSRTMGYSRKELNKVVRDAVTCAKKVKTELKISEKPLSVSYVGIRKLEEKTGIAGKNVLVIGSGKTASLALKYIYEYGAAHVITCSRTFAHAKALREQFEEMEVIAYEDRYQAMDRCSIVISATSCPHLIVKKEYFHVTHKVTFLDLAAPRDIDMTLEELPNVKIINLDSLQEIVKENQKERERLVLESKEIILKAVQETEEWLRCSRMDATIESLQQRCSEIVADSYDYLNRKMELSKRDQKLVRKVLNASLQRLLREPIQELKQLDSEKEQQVYEEFIRQLFQV